jgi:hypothetical protein
MTSVVTSRQETPAALLFGTGTQSQQAAAQRDLGPHLRRNIRALARLPKTMRHEAIVAIVAAVIVLLEFDVIELLVDGWREHHDLTDAARHTLATPGSSELVALATHRITVSQQPSIDLFLNGERVETVEIELTVEFDISAAVAGVSAGMMTALHAGRCDITATLAIQGVEAIQKNKRIDLPGVLSLKQGIRLLDETDYAKANQAQPAAAGQQPTAGSSKPETIKLAPISNGKEGTTTHRTS